MHPRIDLRRTLEPLVHGRGDPTIRFAADGIWRATRTPSGPATLRLVRLSEERVAVEAWGTGAEVALGEVPALIGLTDDPAALVTHDRAIAILAHRFPGLRLPRSGRMFEALLPAILEQKVTGTEARAAYRALIHRYGERAPGPGRLWLAPAPSVLAGLPYHAFHPLGVERRRAETIRRAAVLADRIEAAAPAQAYRLLGAIPGIGAWTLAEVGRAAFGDPDAVSVGDYHLPNRIAWVLAGEARATDRRMIELLEPYRGQRARVQRLVEVSGIGAPRYGPRMAPRQIGAI